MKLIIFSDEAQIRYLMIAIYLYDYYYYFVMRTIFVGIILMFACIHFGLASPLMQRQQLKTGKLQLISSFGGLDRQIKTFFMDQDYQKGDRVVVNLQDLKVDNGLYQLETKVTSLQVKFVEELGQVTLEAIDQKFNKSHQSNWVIVVSYIIIKKQINSDIFFIQNVKLDQFTSIKHLSNQMILTVSADLEVGEQKDEKYQIVVLQRGFQMGKNKGLGSQLKAKMEVKGFFVKEGHVHIQTNFIHIKTCFITLLIIDKAELYAFSIQITHTFDLNSPNTFVLTNQFSIQKCSSAQNSNKQHLCWQAIFEKQGIQFKQIRSLSLNPAEDINQTSYDIEDWSYSPYGRKRLLSQPCFPTSCTCSSKQKFAITCYENTKCSCKIVTCATGYYTTGYLVDKCTICPTTLTNCLACGLQYGSSIVACTSCATGYTVINGVCVACPLGCSSCTTVLVGTETKVSCTACLATLVLQTSGSIKVCGCLSSQYLNIAVSPVVCVNCPTGCSTCSSSTICTSCSTGYYISGSTCPACMPVCKTCLTGSTCLTCLSSTFVSISGVCTCPSTLFFDTTTKSCLSCTSLYPNCASCAYSTTYDPANPPSVDCVTANSGFTVIAGAPVACISYCSNCNLAPGTLCTTANTNFTFDGVSCVCQAGLYFSPTANTCLSCDQVVPGCSTCQTTTIPNPTQCTSCNSAGYFNPSAYPTTSCTACPSLCTACTASNACTFCVNNLIVLGDGSCGCNSVSLFLDPITLNCLSCSAVIFNCQTCATSGTSVTCSTCLAGNYPSSTGYTCYPCPATCSACLNSTYCTSCETGYELSSNLCVCGTACNDCMSNSTGICSSCTYSPSFSCSSCVTGYYSSGGNCLLCNLVWSSCTECTISTCLSCQSPFIVVSTGCACNNTAGLYKSIVGSTCLSCSSIIANCSTCSNTGSTICSSCDLGYYVSSSQVCSPCTGNCLTCSSTSSHCESCLVTYVMVSPFTCACNNTDGYFYDASTAGCSPCSSLLSNCLTCVLNATSQTVCSLCASTYYWDTTSFSCVACSTSCNDCSSFSYCTSCPYNLIPVLGVCVCNSATIPAVYLDTSSGTCQQCSFIISGCTSCTDNGTSIVCNGCVGSTYLVNNTCANCPVSCATCNSTSCLSCPGTLTLSQGVCICSSSCQQCNSLSIGCLSCLITSNVITTCYSCSPGTYLVSPSCIVCPSTCTTCTSSFNCLTCQDSYVLINGMCLCASSIGMFPNSLGVCTACSQIYYACTECDMSNGLTVCSVCSDGYYLSGGSCLPCDISCPTCSGSATTCTSCPTGETLTGTTCACTTASCLACSAVSAHCSQCIYTIFGNFSSCQTCMAGYYVNGVNCSPCPSVCKSCGANGACLSCATSFEVINQTCLCDSSANMWQSGNICVSCISLYSNCQTCIQNASVGLNVSCSLCQYGYFLNNSLCVASFCSDGLITSGQTCDDKNVFNGDGCSSFCQTQNNFICVGEPSVCTVHVNFSLTNTAIEVSKTICNRVTISFQIYPIYDSYETANFQNLFGFVSQTKLIYKSCSYSKGIVKYDFDYTDNLFDILAIFYFTPSALVSQTSTLPIITTQVLLKSTNNVILAYYEKKDCDSKQTVKALAKAIEYASYGTLLVSALPCKIVGLQLFGVLQLAHINIGNMDNVNTMMTPLMGMKGVHGFTLNFGKQSSKSSQSRLLQSGYTPNRVESIGYESNFLRNCNVMLFIVIAVVFISLILYIFTYCCKTCAPSLHSISKRIIKEVLLTLILFNCYNFAYSAGIHFNYAPKYDSLYTLGTVAAILSLVLPVVMALGLMCSEDEGFGEYKEKFKPGVVERLYFVVTILYRTGIGLYISTMNQDEMSTLIVMALSISFLLYNLVNLPYAKAYHNYRANICHLTQFISLFVAMYYRSMMSSTSRSALSTVFTPVYIQLTCICISLLVSMIVLTYEIYIFIKECCQKKQPNNTKTKLSSEPSIHNEKSIPNHVEKTEGDIQVNEENVDPYEFYGN